MVIRDFKVVVKTLSKSFPLYSLPSIGNDSFLKNYGFDSIKTLEFVSQWGYRGLNNVSAFRMTPDIWAAIRPSEFIWIRSVCNGEVLEDGATVVTRPPEYGNTNQLWKIDYVHNPFAYPYLYAVISSYAAHKCLTAQRRDDVLVRDETQLSWCEDQVLTDKPRSRSAIIGSNADSECIRYLIFLPCLLIPSSW